MVERSSETTQVKQPVITRPRRRRARTGELRAPSAWLVLWWAVFLFLIGAGLIGANALIFYSGWARPGQVLPVALRSPLLANYGVDSIGALLPQVEMRIIQDALADRARMGNDQPVDQLSTVAVQLLTPVPSVTSDVVNPPVREPTATQDQGIMPTATLSHTPARTHTQLPSATATASATVTYLPTAAPTGAGDPPITPPTKTPPPAHPDPTSVQPPKPTVQPTAVTQVVPTERRPTVSPDPTDAPYPSPGEPYPPP